MNALHTWLYTGSLFGIARISWAALTGLAVVELVLGRFGGPRTKSVLSSVTAAVHTLLVTVHFDAIPIIGPIVVAILGAISNAPPTVGVPAVVTPTEPEPPKAA